VDQCDRSAGGAGTSCLTRRDEGGGRRRRGEGKMGRAGVGGRRHSTLAPARPSAACLAAYVRLDTETEREWGHREETEKAERENGEGKQQGQYSHFMRLKIEKKNKLLENSILTKWIR
jgi:hypothetical protein